VLRLVAGTAFIARAVARLSGDLAIGAPALVLFEAGLAFLLIAGLWTPVASALAALTEIAILFSAPADPWIHVLLATLGVSLALLGPGAWSIDARLFGWKRIDVRDRQRDPHTSSGSGQ